MNKVTIDISMSLDGYVTAPGATEAEPLGKGGERLHDWVSDPAGQEVLQRSGASLGAVICGRRTYEGSLPWWGADGVTGERRLPMYVLTTRPTPDDGLYHFTPSPQAALAAVGDRDVAVMGGAETVRAFLAAGVVDEIQLHVVPVVFGGGIRLFEDLSLNLTPVEVVDTPAATHLRYRL
jgi:dihydrofolate reductase